jgi:hypothetical protein
MAVPWAAKTAAHLDAKSAGQMDAKTAQLTCLEIHWDWMRAVKTADQMPRAVKKALPWGS